MPNYAAAPNIPAATRNSVYPASNYAAAPNIPAAAHYAGFAPQPGGIPGVQTFGHAMVPIVQQPGVVAYGHHPNVSTPWPQVFSHQIGFATTHSVQPYLTQIAPTSAVLNATAASNYAAQQVQRRLKERLKPPKMRVKQTGQQPKRQKRVPDSKDTKTAASTDLLDKHAPVVSNSADSSDLRDKLAPVTGEAMPTLPQVSQAGANRRDKAEQSSSLPSAAADTSVSPDNHYAEV